MREIEWTEPALQDLAALDKGIARRIKQAVEVFAATGVGNVKRLQGVLPPEFRIRSGDYRVRFHLDGSTLRVLPRPQPQGGVSLREALPMVLFLPLFVGPRLRLRVA